MVSASCAGGMLIFTKQTLCGGIFHKQLFQLTPKVYNTEVSNWKEGLLGNPVMSKIMLHYMRKDSKVSVCSAYITSKQTVFSYHVSRAVVTSFPQTKLDTTLVCLSLRLVYQRGFLQFQLWEAIFFPTSRNKNALN